MIDGGAALAAAPQRVSGVEASAKVTCPPVDTIDAGSHGQLYAVAGAEPHARAVVVPATRAPCT